MDEANQCLGCKKPRCQQGAHPDQYPRSDPPVESQQAGRTRPQLPERCLSRKAGIVRCCLKDRGSGGVIPFRTAQIRFCGSGSAHRPAFCPAPWKVRCGPGSGSPPAAGGQTGWKNACCPPALPARKDRSVAAHAHFLVWCTGCVGRAPGFSA